MNAVKFVLLVFCASMGLYASAQANKYANTYADNAGKLHFFASTPLEDIEATSNKAVCVINTETKKVYAKVPMTSFVFPKKLMQEHFNENYIESEKYPYGTLEAVITDNIDFTKDGTYNINLKGTFEVHGVKQDRIIPGTLTIKNGQPVSATTKFDVKLVDHKIKIPTAVVAKIAEVVKVDGSYNFKKYSP